MREMFKKLITDLSKLYENLVFLHLRKKTKSVYYFKEKQEVDFYAKLDDKEVLVNISYKIDNDKTKQREINGLIEAMEYFKLDMGYLITEDIENMIEIDDKKIYVIPLYKYLLI